MPSLDRAAIDPDADRVVRKLTRAGHKAYLVGGCVRDLLVAKTPKDFDVATSATPNEIKATFRNCRIIGRRFRLAHVFFGAKIIETSTFRANPRDEQIADASPHEVRLVACAGELADHAIGVGIDRSSVKRGHLRESAVP